MSAARSRQVATLLLTAVTAIWGSTFFLIRDVVQQISPADFLAIRFTIAAVAMTAVFWRPMLALDRRELTVGVGLGLLYAAAQLLQTVGLAHTEASRSGFITGTYVVLTPVLGGILLRERIPRSTWVAVLMAAAGLATLSLRGIGLGFGETVTLLAAVIYALHIIGLGRYSSPATAAGLSTLQMVVIAAVSLVAAAPGGVELPTGGHAWASVLYMALIAGAVALWAQTWAQSHLAATRAAIVMTLEPVFAAAFAVALGGESLTSRIILGGAMVLAAMYTVELFGRRADATAEQDPPAELLHHEV
ncbi:MAG TPA: DMT family transporter [Dermatophilaceae bacterium]|nr:DMT family transporter [Dermatophilaceae bacterium]